MSTFEYEAIRAECQDGEEDYAEAVFDDGDTSVVISVTEDDDTAEARLSAADAHALAKALLARLAVRDEPVTIPTITAPSIDVSPAWAALSRSISAALRPTVEVGDRVEVVANSGDPFHYLKVGSTAVVTRVYRNAEDKPRYDVRGYSRTHGRLTLQIVRPTDVRPLTPGRVS